MAQITIDEYISILPGRPSSVKRQILDRLWEEGGTFPRGWVSSAELLALTGQKYFDRRVRELRDQTGCDIETGTVEGRHAYRLLSTVVKSENPRGYLADKKKKQLFHDAQYHCSVCGRQCEAGVRGLQADHKVPLNRGGSQDDLNWQPLCVECNVGKRRACAGCDLDCQICPWAFPERVGRRIVVPVTQDVELSLNKYAMKTGRTIEFCVAEALADYFSRER